MSSLASATPAATAGKTGLPRRRFDKRLLAVVVLLPILVFAWLPLLQGKPPAPNANGPATAASAPAAPPTAAAAPLVEARVSTAALAGSSASIAELGQRIRALTSPYEPRWHEPGYMPPAVTKPVDPSAPAEVPPANAGTPPPAGLMPSAILLTPGGNSMALVRGKLRAVGDVVDGYLVVAIEAGRIDYRLFNNTFTVHMPAPGLGGSR